MTDAECRAILRELADQQRLTHKAKPKPEPRRTMTPEQWREWEAVLASLEGEKSPQPQRRLTLVPKKAKR